MARTDIDFVEDVSQVTPGFARKSDWINTSASDAHYIPYIPGESETEWPKDSNGKPLKGLTWPKFTAIPANPTERFHVMFRSKDGRIEGYEAGGT